MCSDTWRAAGTTDRIYVAKRDLHLPDGSVAVAGTCFIGDLKTGKRLDYNLPGFAIQLAIYCDGCFYDVATDERSPLPDASAHGLGTTRAPASRKVQGHLMVDRSPSRAYRSRPRAPGAGVARARRLLRSVRVPRVRRGRRAAVPDLRPRASGTRRNRTPPAEWGREMQIWAQARINAIGNYSEAASLTAAPLADPRSPTTHRPAGQRRADTYSRPAR